MKKYILLLLTACALVWSCNNDLPQGVSYSGDAVTALSENTKAILETLTLPEDCHLVVHVDSVCRKNDYLDAVKIDGNAIVVHAYLEPRFMKADIFGAAGGELTGAAGAEYLALQMEYADGKPLDVSVISMSKYLLDVHEQAEAKYAGFFKKLGANGFKSFIDDLIFSVSFIIKPYDNFWGSLMKPFYLFSAKCVEWTGSAMSGLLLMCTLIASVMLSLLFLMIYLIRSGWKKFGIFWGGVSDVISWVSIIPILIFGLFIAMPRYENVVALQNVYGYDNADLLLDAYLSRTFAPSSVWLVVIAIVLSLANKVVNKFAQLQAQGKKLEGEDADNLVQQLGESSYGVLLLALCAVIIDKIFVLAYILFYSLKLVRSIILMWLRSGSPWLILNSGKCFMTLLGAGLFAFIIWPSKDTNELADPYELRERSFAQKVYSSGEIDTMSYLMGMDYAHYVRSKAKKDADYLAAGVALDGMAARLRNKLLNYENPTREDKDIISYQLGAQYASDMKKSHYIYGVGELNETRFVRGYMDALHADRNTEFWLDKSLINTEFKNWLAKRTDYFAERNKQDEECFLQNNSTRPGVQSTSSGLQYIIHDPGTGKKIRSSSTVKVKYTGRYINGEVFDSQTADLKVNKLIRGWKEGLCLLASGGKMTLYIPSDLAYGSSWAGNVEPNSLLIFDLEVVKVVRR